MRLLWLSFLMLSLVACGFQLRGTLDWPEALNSIAVQADGGSHSIKSVVQIKLVQNNVKIKSSADTKVYLSHYRQNRQLQKDASGTTVSVNLSAQVLVAINHGEVEKLSATRSLEYAGDALLSQSEEEALLIAQLQQALAQKILYRIKNIADAH